MLRLSHARRLAIVGIALCCTAPGYGVLFDPSDVANIKALRLLLPPEDLGADNNDYQAGGIDGKGNVFGMRNSARGHRETRENCSHCEDPLVWIRSENYVGKVAGALGYAPAFNLFSLSFDSVEDLDNEIISDDVRAAFEANGVPLHEPEVSLNLDEKTKERLNWSIRDFDPADTDPDRPLQVFDILFDEKNEILPVNDLSQRKPHGVHAGSNRQAQEVGFLHFSNVSESGHVGGSLNGDNWDAFHYHMDTDRFTIFRDQFEKDENGNTVLDDKGNPKIIKSGHGVRANSHGIVISTWSSYSENPSAFIASPDHPDGIIQVLGGFSMHAWGINDDNIIVGEFEGNPYRLMPAGEKDGFPFYDPLSEDDFMAEAGPVFVDSQALAISNNDTPYAAGTSNTFSGPKGVIWDVLSGEILAELGTAALPFGITDDGTIAYGSVKTIFPPQTENAVFWITNDGWKTFKQVMLNDLLEDMKQAGVPGAELVESFEGLALISGGCCWVAGVNNSGQMAIQGNMAEPGIGALGIVPSIETSLFLLDTVDLDGGVLKGDVNNDGVVNFLDITPFINAQASEGDAGAFLELTPDGCFLCADIDMDGVVDFLDITPYVNLLDQVGGAALPEPGALAAILMLGLSQIGRRRRR